MTVWFPMDIIQGDVVNFPDEIWEKVLARLPIASLFRTRTVCKRWKAIVDSESFKVIYSHETPHDIFFLCFVYDDFQNGVSALCSAERNRWYTIPFTQACLNLNLSKIQCSGGPFLVTETRNNDIVVCNIITKVHRILPPMLPINGLCFARAIVVFNNGHYKVLAETYSGRTQLYDSENNSWEMCVQFNTGLLEYKSYAYLNGLLYFLSYDEKSLIAIDIHGDRTWNVVQQNMPNGLFLPFIMDYEGSLLLVGGILRNRGLRSINIWQLHEMEWRVVSTMPDCLLRGFQRQKTTCIRTIGMRGKICFFKQTLRSSPCMYHLSKGEWVSKLASCPNPPDRRIRWIGVAIEPRLHMELK